MSTNFTFQGFQQPKIGGGIGGGIGTNTGTTTGVFGTGTGTNILGGGQSILGGGIGTTTTNTPGKNLFGGVSGGITGIGGVQTQNTGIGGGLLNKPATTTNTLFQGQGQQQGLSFGAGIKPAGGGMFGTGQTTTQGTGLGTGTGTGTGFNFGGTQQLGQQPTLFGGVQTQNQNLNFNPLSNQNQLQQSQLINTQNSNKKELDKHEILQVIQNYMSCLNPKTAGNAFKFMLYNRIPKGYENQIQYMQQFKGVDRAEDGSEVLLDYNLWMKALQNNPNPHLYFPYQISSPSQLVQRTKTTEILEFTALETIVNLQNNLSQLNNTYDIEIDNEVCGIKEKMQRIKNKQLQVMSKIERLALITGKADKKFQMETSINNKLNTLKNVLSENVDYVPKIQELSTMTTLMGLDNQVNEEKDYFKDMDKERLEKNVNVLRDMKKIFDVTINSLKNNLATVNFIQNDLDSLQRYGKITK